MKNATISIKDVNKLYEVTKTAAHYKIILPAGAYEVEFNCHGYKPVTKSVTISRDLIVDLNVTLEVNSENPEIDAVGTVELADVRESPLVGNNRSFIGVEGNLRYRIIFRNLPIYSIRRIRLGRFESSDSRGASSHRGTERDRLYG